MPKFAEDEELSDWVSQADSAACWGEGRLPWQRVVEEEASKPEAALNPALKGGNLGRKDIDILEKYPCCSIGSCCENSISHGCCEGRA